MAFELVLPRQLAKAGWKVKIRDKERLEEPHCTIIKKTATWRVGLRSRAFLDAGKWKDFPDKLCEAIEENWDALCRQWDAMYPHNPVLAAEDDDDDENG
jgi:hypothetical protein